MPKLKLTYFDFHGGRGEPARLALSIGDIPFEDDRVAPSDWTARKPDTPFGALPVLEVDGQTLAQSNAINRYVGKLTDLYPSDPWQAALCDEVMEAVEDISTKLAAPFSFRTRKRKPSARRWSKGRCRSISPGSSSGSKHMEAATLLRIACRSPISRSSCGSDILSPESLDHVPADLPDRVAPKLVEHYERVKNDPLVVLDELGRDAIGQVGRHMIKHSGLKVPDPHEDLEIRD